MTKEEAMVFMLNGGMIVNTQKGLTFPRIYFYSQDERCFKRYSSYDLGSSTEVNLNYKPKDGWEIYTPPKKKVKMWQWVRRGNTSGKYTLSVQFFKTKEDAENIHRLSDITIIQKAEWTEIEVEV